MTKRDEILGEISVEATKAINKHGPVHSLHEAYGLIAEELAEFFDEVRKKSTKRDLKNTRQELVQIAAICVKTIENLL